MPHAAAFPAPSAADRRAEAARWRRRSRLIRTLRVLLPAVMLVIVGLLVRPQGIMGHAER